MLSVREGGLRQRFEYGCRMLILSALTGPTRQPCTSKRSSTSLEIRINTGFVGLRRHIYTHYYCSNPEICGSRVILC